MHYFGDTIGVPAALAVTGGVILLIAAFTTKLARFTRTPTATPHPGQRRFADASPGVLKGSVSVPGLPRLSYT